MKKENEPVNDLNAIPAAWLDVLLQTKAFAPTEDLQTKKMIDDFEKRIKKAQLSAETLE